MILGIYSITIAGDGVNFERPLLLISWCSLFYSSYSLVMNLHIKYVNAADWDKQFLQLVDIFEATYITLVTRTGKNSSLHQ